MASIHMPQHIEVVECKNNVLCELKRVMLKGKDLQTYMCHQESLYQIYGGSCDSSTNLHRLGLNTLELLKLTILCMHRMHGAPPKIQRGKILLSIREWLAFSLAKEIMSQYECS